MSLKDLSIVIPAHNEENRIKNTLTAYSAFFDKQDINYRIFVVINNTKDRTKEIVQDMAKKNKRIEFVDLPRGGKGYAVVEGFKDSLAKKYRLIGFVDADMATPPQSFYDLYLAIGDTDGVVANRYLKQSKNSPEFTMRRLVVAKVFNFIVRSFFLLKHTDTQCGAKLFKAEALKTILPLAGMTQWAFDVELLYLARVNNLEVKSIPTIWSDVAGSKIKIGKSSIQMLLSVVQLRLRHSPASRLMRPLKFVVVPLWKSVK